jgi:hypothetical protein
VCNRIPNIASSDCLVAPGMKPVAICTADIIIPVIKNFARRKK